MQLTCLADCSSTPPWVVALLLAAAALAGLTAYRAPKAVFVLAPLLGIALLRCAGQGFSHAPTGWLTALVLMPPIVCAVAGRWHWLRSSNGTA